MKKCEEHEQVNTTSSLNTKMEQHVLKIVIEYRGRHKKGITIFNATEVSLQQNFMFEL